MIEEILEKLKKGQSVTITESMGRWVSISATLRPRSTDLQVKTRGTPGYPWMSSDWHDANQCDVPYVGAKVRVIASMWKKQ
jgi:hypothetical protein